MSNPYPTQNQPTTAPPGWVLAPPEHPQGTVILVLGVLGFVTGVTGVVAWILGSKVRKEIRATGAVYSNAQSIEIGWVCGVISTILMALGVVLVVVYVIIMVIFFSTMMASMPR